jgi:hypothetical protein
MESGYIGVFIRRDAAVTAGIRLPDGDAEVATNERSRVVGVAGRVGTAPIRPYRNGQLRDRHGLPIVELFGPSVPAVVEGIAELAQATLDNKIASDLHAELATQAGLVLQGRAAPAAEAAE